MGQIVKIIVGYFIVNNLLCLFSKAQQQIVKPLAVHQQATESKLKPI